MSEGALAPRRHRSTRSDYRLGAGALVTSTSTLSAASGQSGTVDVPRRACSYRSRPWSHRRAVAPPALPAVYRTSCSDCRLSSVRVSWSSPRTLEARRGARLDRPVSACSRVCPLLLPPVRGSAPSCVAQRDLGGLRGLTLAVRPNISSPSAAKPFTGALTWTSTVSVRRTSTPARDERPPGRSEWRLGRSCLGNRGSTMLSSSNHGEAAPSGRGGHALAAFKLQALMASPSSLTVRYPPSSRSGRRQ